MENKTDSFIKNELQKDHLISKKADDVFNNFFKEVEHMENKENEKLEEKTETKENEKIENNPKKPKWKKVLSIAACLLVLLVGSNIYATSKGYDNIFFLIKHVIQGGNITDRNEILSDKDITISYKPISIGKGIEVQVNELKVKNNEAKLYLVIDTQKATEEIKKLNFKVTSSDNKEMCNEEQTKSIEAKYNKELTLKNFKDDTKLLNLTIKANDIELSTLKIDLEKKEIEIDGEKELEKISEIELKEYLNAFALLNYDYTGESFEAFNERKLLAAGAFSREILHDSDINKQTKFEVTEMNNIVKSMIYIQFEDDGLIKTENNLFTVETLNGKQYYSYIEQIPYPTSLCLNIDDITYSDGIYNVKFTYCYPAYQDYETDNIENISRFTSIIKLSLNDNSEYSKYHIEDVSVLSDENENDEDQNNNETKDTNSNPTPTPTSTPTPVPSTSNKYESVSSTNWNSYRSAGLQVIYPDNFTVTETTDPNKGNNFGELYSTISGKVFDVAESTESDLKIELFEPELYSKEEIDYLENKIEKGDLTSNITGTKWYRIKYTQSTSNPQVINEVYVARVGLNYDDGSDTVVKISFTYSPPTVTTTSFVDHILGEARFASY